MNKGIQKIILICGLILLISLAVLAFWYYRGNIIKQGDNQSSKDTSIIEDKKLTDNTKPLKIDITYPYIKDLYNFNDRVAKEINNQLEDFKNIALENDKFFKNNDPQGYANNPRTYELNISYVKSIPDKNTVSIVFKVYEDTGGAHPNGFFTSLSYDISKNKEINLVDLFGEDYLNKIADFCKKDLEKQVTAKTGSMEGFWIDEGAAPKEENFSNFLIKDKSVVFYFSPYQIGPYAAGDFQVEMPR